MNLNLLYLSLICSFFICGSLSSLPVLKATPAFIHELEDITVFWTNIPNPTTQDWIGIYFSSNNSSDAYIGYQYANSSSTWSKGFGSLRFQLLNMRTSYYFRYFGPDYTLLATSNFIYGDNTTAMQVHLQLTGDPAQMRVMWVSGIPNGTQVKYGLSQDNLQYVASGTSDTYSKEDMLNCERNSYAVSYFIDPGFIHNVLLTNLKSNTKYYYRVGDGENWSKVFHFIAPKLIGPEVGIKVIAFGDMGTSDCENMKGWCEMGSQGTSARMNQLMTQKTDYDMVLHIGDISYAVGYGERWEQFFWQIQSISSQIPWMVSIGNHEYDYKNQPFKPDWSNYGDDSHGECGVPFQKRFYMPNSNGLWYSFDYGNIHFTLFSAEHDFTQGSEQYLWIKNDLTSVNRSLTPFIIVGAHRPMYCSGNYTSDYIMSLHLQEELEDLFYQTKVNLALWGHYHSYERTCPVYKQKCDPNGTINLVIGNAGQTLSPSWIEPKPDWSIFRDATHFGLSLIETNSTTLHFQYFANYIDSPLDEFWIHATK